MSEIIYSEIFKRYIDYFYTLNDDNYREYFKREMVRHFRDTWNLQAEDFPTIIKESIFKKSSVFLDDKYNCPANGLVKLVSHPEAVEEVKSLFARLFSDDGGNIEKRQDRIEEFVDRCNELLDLYEPGKWKYKQSFRTGLAYLTFFDPVHNYFYKATECHQMAEMLQFGADLGHGQSFSLKNYYLMCDRIKEAIRNCDELMEINRKLIDDVNARQPEFPLCDYDDEHILVFDIIWAGKYEIYSDLYYPIEARKAETRKNPNASRLAELSQELEEQKKVLDSAQQERSSYDSFSAIGLDVEHRVFGKGRIIDQDGDRILVRLENTEKWFSLPGAFSNGFLNTDDNEVREIMLRIAELDNQISSAKNRLFNLSGELRRLNI